MTPHARTWSWTLGILLATAVAPLACRTPPAERATPAGPTPPDAMLACNVHADCEVVQMSCCHYCNPGSWVLGVNRASVAAARERYANHCPEGSEQTNADGSISFSGTSCLDCNVPTAGYCERGRCTWAFTDGDAADPELTPQPNVIRTARP